jgi:hypothetical protein
MPLLASDRERLGEGADLHAAEVRIVGLDDVRELAEQTLAALARVRTLGRSADDVTLRMRILEDFRQVGLLPSQLIGRLGARRLADLDGH